MVNRWFNHRVKSNFEQQQIWKRTNISPLYQRISNENERILHHHLLLYHHWCLILLGKVYIVSFIRINPKNFMDRNLHRRMPSNNPRRVSSVGNHRINKDQAFVVIIVHWFIISIVYQHLSGDFHWLMRNGCVQIIVHHSSIDISRRRARMIEWKSRIHMCKWMNS